MVFENKEAKKHGIQIGCYYEALDEPTEEVLAVLKEKAVNKICREIRKIAKENDDFFIVKTGENFALGKLTTTVGVKVELPTVKEK